MDTSSRRQLLQAGGVCTALALGGCSSLGFQGDDSDGSSDTDAMSVTVAADIDQERRTEIQQKVQAREQQIQQQLEEGEIDEEEAQQLRQELQQQAQKIHSSLLTESITAIEEHIVDADGLSVADSVGEMGILLVEGNAVSLIELLNLAEVGALLDEAQFEKLQQQGS